MLAIRRARADEAPLVFALMHELAVYERMDTPELFRVTEAIVARDIVGPKARLQAEIAEWDGAPAGLCLWYRTYGSFRAAPGIYLEDIFVRPEFRGKGIGKSFFLHLADVAKEEGAYRIEWSVLDWNESAMGFYKSLGAGPVQGWQTFRLAEPALKKLQGE